MATPGGDVAAPMECYPGLSHAENEPVATALDRAQEMGSKVIPYTTYNDVSKNGEKACATRHLCKKFPRKGLEEVNSAQVHGSQK